MIWGRTTEEKKAARPKIGDERIRFMWYPDWMPDGRWCWWCWVKQKFDGYTYMGDSGQKWPILEIVKPWPGK